ncbi:STAS domain-containing protein [Flindersiella endophytica]
MQPENHNKGPEAHEVNVPIWAPLSDDHQLSCEHSELPHGMAKVAVVGEIDQATSPRLKTELLKAIARMSPHLVIDMSGVTFIDSAGLTVILAARQRARAQGGDTYLLGPTKQIRKVLAITSLDRLLEIHETLETVRPASPSAG